VIKNLLSKILTKLFGYKYYHVSVAKYENRDFKILTFLYQCDRLKHIENDIIEEEVGEDVAIINVVRCEKYKE